MSLINRVASFARSPQGRRAFGQAKRYAQSPKGRACLLYTSPSPRDRS